MPSSIRSNYISVPRERKIAFTAKKLVEGAAGKNSAKVFTSGSGTFSLR